ncbi:chemotaxis protein CheA [Saccharobesus litoralis]|uniref:Chemotaxis protein CheA n=1 Tax=Saccharobesus litoralis TaxID=2172099 RepID=A0A2S0VR51_9ALTE|nr:chemotaxis protein CheA [Saccharobesus litoralis]AWB66698.1 chemotaxis protein CheA [Saccharobesus litoralis]
MSVDLSQFYEVFFEESFEGLDAMESELLDLQPGTPDSETINTIFRAAHSIKGGSGTFGFTSVSEFTHVVETLLDQIRDGQRLLTQNQIDLFLQSVDCLRDMLGALRNSEEPDTQVSGELKAAFEQILNGGEDSQQALTSATESEPQPEAPAGNAHWSISLKPGIDILKTGNEPIFMMQELAELGKTKLAIDVSKVPTLNAIEADNLYLNWQIELESGCDEAAINEIFDWIIDESDIQIQKVESAQSAGEGNDSFDVEAESVAASASTNEQTPESKQEPEKGEEPQAVEPPSGTDVKAAPAKKETPKASTESSSIRVSIDKVDSLINMVGELVITQAMLNQLTDGEFDRDKLSSIQEGMAQLAHNTRDLQESVMRIRMLPISFVFSRFPRLVRDTSKKLGKQIELVLKGESTELDKTVMEKISDPMVHLVRNSMDHGLETPQDRLAAGKDETGILTLNAYHQGGNVVVEIIDDGRGLNTDKIKQKALENGLIKDTDELTEQQINELIFEPGFSTADAVSDLSGRGVGMDVVRRNIQALNGSVELESRRGEGATFTIRLPLTLAILDGQLIRVGEHVYIIPLINIIESLQINPETVNNVGGEYDVLRLREEYVPIIRLHQVFNHESESKKLAEGLLVVVESDNGKVGIWVDELLGQQQVVIKSLEANYRKVDGISGATILGDGTVSLIIDIGGLVKLAGLRKAVRVNALANNQAAEAI